MNIVSGVQVRGVLQSAKNRVRDLLRRRMAELHAVALALINQETLDHAQISAICQKASESAAAETPEFIDETSDAAAPIPV